MPGSARDVDLPSVGLDDPLDDSEAKAGTAALVSGIGAIEALEDVRKVVARDADAIIADLEEGT